MHKLSPLLLLAVALTASSCVTESRSSRFTQNSRSSNVWGQTPASYQVGTYGQSGADRYATTGIYRSPQGGYHLYTGVSGIPDTTRLYRPVAPRNEKTSGYRPVAGYASASEDFNRRHLSFSSSGARSYTPRSQVAPTSRSALPESSEPWRQRAITTPAQSPADRLASASLPAPSGSIDEAANSRPSRNSGGAPSEAEQAKLPFAQPVPGRSGYVKLPDHPQLPEIDVRGIAPGTPVEVPNPAGSGATIQFRVP